MKTVILSVKVLICGYFCDICRAICQKYADKSLRRGEPLTKKLIILLSSFTEKSLAKWQKLEKRFIYLLSEAETF